MLVTVFRDKYIYRRELLWPSCLSINRKKANVIGIVLERFSQESSWNNACDCVFEWLTVCEDVGNACAAMAQLSFMVFGLLLDGEMDICKVPRAGSVCFVCLWRVRSEEQISVSYHLLQMFSQQYSVTSICSVLNGKMLFRAFFS